MDIPAPPPLVWSVMADIERWPEWTASVSRVKQLSAGPLRVGSCVRIHQPKLPPAFWRVTQLNPNTGFACVSVAPGVRVVAKHWIDPVPDGCRVTLSIHYQGLLGPILSRWVGDLNDRYLVLEASGLKARSIELVGGRGLQ
jgi:hypothetical protein